ncbi:hypothetical protein H312_02405, partial [Anncaliia algerae PRA339]
RVHKIFRMIHPIMVIFVRVFSKIINVRRVFFCMNNTFFINVFLNIAAYCLIFSIWNYYNKKIFDSTSIPPRTICSLASLPWLYLLLPKKQSSICTILHEPPILMGLLEVKSCTNFYNFKKYLETVLIDNPINLEIKYKIRKKK